MSGKPVPRLNPNPDDVNILPEPVLHTSENRVATVPVSLYSISYAHILKLANNCCRLKRTYLICSRVTSQLLPMSASCAVSPKCRYLRLAQSGSLLCFHLLLP